MRMIVGRRVCLGLVGILVLAVASSALTLHFTLRSERAYQEMIARNREQSTAIYELEIALLGQSGLTASYILDGSPHWLEELDRRKLSFENLLARAGEAGLDPDELAYLPPIRNSYESYASARDQVITLYDRGRQEEARRVLLTELAAQYDYVYRLCEALSDNNRQDIASAITSRQALARRVSFWVGISLAALAGLVLAVAWYLIRRVFGPLRRITEETHDHLGTQQLAGQVDEIEAVGACVATLKSNMAQLHSNLARTNRRLFDAEQLALVGKLAAGVAHEVRSPLTALKLRLFSMQKALNGDPRYQSDAKVMFEELERLDYIVRSFLEFSRTPDLRVQPCDVTLLLDKALELLRYKLVSASISTQRYDEPALAPILADPQQFQQVLVNLLNNAIDAQPDGGHIRITTSYSSSSPPGMVFIRIEDSGPGVAAEAADRIFDPFYSGKDDGVGLGLWVAHRIVTEHGGSLELESSRDGAIFAVCMPVAARGQQ